MRDKGERKRLRSGRWAMVFTATQNIGCDGCSRRIRPGDLYVLSRKRARGRMIKTTLCVDSCEPLDTEGPNTPEGNSMRLKTYGSGRAVCGYCGHERVTTRLRQRLDPRTLRIAHEMPLCDQCADGSGYTLPSYGRNTNLITRPGGMPRVGR